jgi:hypothetical protein
VQFLSYRLRKVLNRSFSRLIETYSVDNQMIALEDLYARFGGKNDINAQPDRIGRWVAGAAGAKHSKSLFVGSPRGGTNLPFAFCLQRNLIVRAVRIQEPCSRRKAHVRPWSSRSPRSDVLLWRRCGPGYCPENLEEHTSPGISAGYFHGPHQFREKNINTISNMICPERTEFGNRGSQLASTDRQPGKRPSSKIELK